MTKGAVVYVDTSVLVKQYLREADSERAVALLERATIATSTISELELVSTLYAAHRARVLSYNQLHVLLKQLEKDCAAWYRLDVTTEVIDRARDVISKELVRALDAIHCASALLLQETRSGPIPFATSDQRQRAAAMSLGFTCL